MSSGLITVFKVTVEFCCKRMLCSVLELLSELAESGEFLEILGQSICIQFCSMWFVVTLLSAP